MLVPKVSPEHMHAGKVCSRAFGFARPKKQIYNGFNPRQLLAYIPDPTPPRVEPLPPEQPRVVISLSQWRRRYDYDTRVLRMYVNEEDKRVDHVIGLKNIFILKLPSPIESSRDTSQTSTAGQPEAPATRTNPFFLLGEKTLSPSVHRRWKERRHKRENLETLPIRSKHLLSPIITMSRHPRLAPTRRKAE